MDTSAGRTRGRLAAAEHTLEQYAQQQKPPFPPRAGAEQNCRDFSNVTCYRCHQKGYISRFCPQDRFPNTFGRQEPRNARAAYRETQQESMVARADTRTAEEKAKDWLAGVAGEDNEVKEKVLKNCGRRRILAAPEPNGLGEGSKL